MSTPVTTPTFGQRYNEALLDVIKHIIQGRISERKKMFYEIRQQIFCADGDAITPYMRAEDVLKDTLIRMLRAKSPMMLTITFDKSMPYSDEQQKAAIDGLNHGLMTHHRSVTLANMLRCIGVKENLACVLAYRIFSKPYEAEEFLRNLEAQYSEAKAN